MPRLRFYPSFILPISALWVALATAQGPAGATSSGPAGETPSAPVFHASANLVLVDVVVTEHGKPVRGLDKSRLHVFEDGKEQGIAAFDEHSLAGAEATLQLPMLPPHTYSNNPLYPQNAAVNILLLDGLNTPLADQQAVRLQMVKYMEQAKPGTSMVIFTLASQLRMVSGFTSDAASLSRALKSSKAAPQEAIVPGAQNSTMPGDMASIVRPGMASSALLGDAGSVAENTTLAPLSGWAAALQQFSADIATFETDQRVDMTLTALDEMARYLAAIPGRKNLIWFSGSFPLVLGPDESQPIPYENIRMYGERVKKTSDLLAAARVAVYPVDARGIMNQTTTAASYGDSASDGGGVLMATATKDDKTFFQQTPQEHATMDAIAAETGGRAFYNTNGFKEALASALDDGSNYYTLAYTPATAKLDGRFHKIELRVDGGKYTLGYRHGFYSGAGQLAQAAGPATMRQAVQHGAPQSTEVLFTAMVLPVTDPLLQNVKLPDGPAGEMAGKLKQPAHRYLAGVTIDPRGLAYTEQSGNLRRYQIECILTAYDGDGKAVNISGHKFGFNLRPEEYNVTNPTPLRLRLALDLPEGETSLRVAVQDLNAARTGSLEIPVLVPKSK